MSTFGSSLLILLLFHHHHAQEYGTCDEGFLIFKHTFTSTDAGRDCANMYRIFPEIYDEGADKFHDGQCAYQCKSELPYSCFRIHAPETFQFDEGALSIATFEKKLSQKWVYALEHTQYDAMMDFNMGFWVKSLDQFITHWESQDITLEVLGIEWQLPSDLTVDISDPSYTDNRWYSILVHSPDAGGQFEFMSFTKPMQYDHVQWTKGYVPRCTFQMQTDPFPWDRPDEATIVPVRVSHGTFDTQDAYAWYTQILSAKTIYFMDTVDDDGNEIRTIFMLLIGTHIELQFTQRAESATKANDFTVKKYIDLLMETHSAVITSQYCGQDRWMDNHFALSLSSDSFGFWNL